MSGSEPLSEQLRATWRRPLSFTTLVPVGTPTRAEVHSRLVGLGPRLKAALPVVKGLHTFRLVSAPPENPGGAARVLLNFVHDEPLDSQLSGLMDAMGESLTAAFAGADFSGVPGDLPPLLVRHRAPDLTFHLGAINKSVRDILAENSLLEAVEAFADARLASGAWATETPAEKIGTEVRARAFASRRFGAAPRTRP